MGLFGNRHDAELENLFQSSVGPASDFKPRRDLGFYVLELFFLFNVGFLTFMLAGLVVGARHTEPISRLFLNPAQTITTFSKMTLMLSLALIGAYNANVRRRAAMVLVIGHVIAVAAQAWLYLGYPQNLLYPADAPYLREGILGDGIVVILFLYLALKPAPVSRDAIDVDGVDLQSPVSTAYRWWLIVVGIAYSGFAIAIVMIRALGDLESGLGAVFGSPDPLVSNSIARCATIAVLCFLLSARAGLRKYLTAPLVYCLGLSTIGCFILALLGKSTIVTRTGARTPGAWFLMVQIAVDGAVLLVTLGLRKLQYQVDYRVTSLSPTSAECCLAAHTALREAEQKPQATAREVLTRVDELVGGVRSRNRGLLAFPFWLIEHVFPIFAGLRPEFSTMSREERRWMMRRYVLRPNYERSRSLVPPIAEVMFSVGDVIHGLLCLCYFTTETAHQQVGYILPDARTRLQPDIACKTPPVGADPPELPLDASDAVGLKPLSKSDEARTLLAPRIAIAYDTGAIPDEVDYCIVGSGAAGGVLAHRLGLSKGDGNSICVLERGAYNSPRQDFSDDELKMISSLYAESGLQLTRSFDFTILQGETVGGTTVINNAICLEMPPPSRKEWASFGFDAQVLESHYARVKSEINIGELSSESVNKTVESLFSRGISGYNAECNGLGPLSQAKRLSGNFKNCLGCGLCNIGCKRMRKMSVLETYLPWAMARGVMVRSGSDALECETEPGVGSKKRVTALVVRGRDGRVRRIRIRKALIVAGGAIQSSRFLMDSKVGGPAVGKGLSCNYAFPTLVEFDELIDAFDGVQITMFAAPESYEAIFETTYNPPGGYSLAIPQYFGGHAKMMGSYRRATNFGTLVGSDPSGSVRKRPDILFGHAIEWNQNPDEISRISRALATLVRIARAAGARRIVLPTHPALSIKLDSSIDQTLSSMGGLLNDKRYFNFATAHPQGGNMMASKSHGERVVDLDFRVRDCDNLFVCDASIFPRGIRVNPQWTIMALASLAAESIAALT